MRPVAHHQQQRSRPPLLPLGTARPAGMLGTSAITTARGGPAAAATMTACGVCGGGRGVPCRELGAGDHQGWLYRRARTSRTFLHHHTWHRRWFILKKGYLYGYSGQDAHKAESLICLPGFHVCPAQDANTKKFAFKIYHDNGATFYFACDSGEERSRWMSEIGLSALSSGRCSDSGSAASSPTAPAAPSTAGGRQEAHRHNEEAYYSETDEELEEGRTLAAAPVLHRHESPARDANIILTTTTTTSSGGGFSSLFHWGSSSHSGPTTTTHSGSGSNKSGVSPAGTGGGGGEVKSSTTATTPGGRASALSSFVSGKTSGGGGGIKFLQPRHVQAVPSANFRSYRCCKHITASLQEDP